MILPLNVVTVDVSAAKSTKPQTRINKYTNGDSEHANAAEKSNISIYLLQVDLYIALYTVTHTTVVVVKICFEIQISTDPELCVSVFVLMQMRTYIYIYIYIYIYVVGSNVFGTSYV